VTIEALVRLDPVRGRDLVPMAALARHLGLFEGLVGDGFLALVVGGQLLLQGLGRNLVAEGAFVGPLVEADGRSILDAVVGAALDAVVEAFRRARIETGLDQLRLIGNRGILLGIRRPQMAGEANSLRGLEVLFRRMLDMAGVAEKLLALQGLFLEVRLVLEGAFFRRTRTSRPGISLSRGNPTAGRRRP